MIISFKGTIAQERAVVLMPRPAHTRVYQGLPEKKGERGDIMQSVVRIREQRHKERVRLGETGRAKY